MESRSQSTTSSFLKTDSLQSQLSQIKKVPASFNFAEEYVNERLVVQGQDRRKMVSLLDHNDYPHSCLGLIMCKNGSQRAVATGVLISSSLVLTSAHSFYEIDEFYKVKINIYTPQAFFVDLKGPLDDEKAIIVVEHKVNEQYKEIIEAIKA